MRRRAAGRRDGAAVIAGLLLLHASCQLRTGGTADELLADASSGGSAGSSDAGRDMDVPDVTTSEPDAGGDASGDAGSDGDAGAVDAGDSAVVCGANPEPLGGPTCPAQCNGGCAGNRCRVLCVTALPCRTVRCPEGFDCEVTCAGPRSCVDLQVQCNSQHRCGLICDGLDGCHGARVQCGRGSCGMLCTNAACREATLNCGSGECFGFCLSPPYPVVSCYDSCGCTPC